METRESGGGTASGGCGSPVAPVFWLSRGKQLPTYRYLHVLSVCVSWCECFSSSSDATSPTYKSTGPAACVWVVRFTYHCYLGSYTPYLPRSRVCDCVSVSLLVIPSATFSPRRRSLARPGPHWHGRRVVMSHASDHAGEHRLTSFFAGGSRETNSHLAPPPHLSSVALPDGRRLPQPVSPHAPRSLNSLTPSGLHHVLAHWGATWPSE